MTLKTLPKFSEKHKKITFAAMGALFIFMAYWFIFIRGIETTDNAYLKSNITMISAHISGYVTQVIVDDNQPVKAGDVIAKIDDRDYVAKVQQAEAMLENTKAHLLSLESQKDLQLSRIRQAESGISSATATLEKSNKDFTRSKNLVKDGAISQQFLDASTADQKNAKASLEKSQAELDGAKSSLAMISAQIDETKAQIKNADASLVLAKIELEYTLIKAPVDGVVGNRSIQVGQLVRPGMGLYFLVPTQDIWVEANFKETQIHRMKPGQPVKIIIDTYPNITFTGTIGSLSPASGSEFSLLPPENATGNFTKIVRRIPVKIIFDATTDRSLLRPGMSVFVKVNTR